MDVTVIVATYGKSRWRELAYERAVPSAKRQAPVIQIHGETLAGARNAGAAKARTEWLCFLDADDELAPGYFEAIDAAEGDLRAPAVQYDDAEPVVLEGRDIRTLNPCVIGTVLPHYLFGTAGGFWSERAWEDWSLFRRCWLLGASIVHVPAAVYRVHTDRNGRNSTVSSPRSLHREITASHRRWLRERGGA